jgi:hypothetical protein
MNAGSSKMGFVQIGIILLTLAAAFIHLGLAFLSPDPTFTPLFILNGAGYLILLAGLFLPLPIARNNRGLVRWLMILLSVAGILAWVAIGDKSLPSGALGYVTKIIEILLIVLLLRDRRG